MLLKAIRGLVGSSAFSKPLFTHYIRTTLNERALLNESLYFDCVCSVQPRQKLRVGHFVRSFDHLFAVGLLNDEYGPFVSVEIGTPFFCLF